MYIYQKKLIRFWFKKPSEWSHQNPIMLDFRILDRQIPNLMGRHKCGNTTNMRMSSWLLYRVARKASRFKMNKQVFQNMRTTTDYVLVNKLLIMNRFTTVSLLESRLKDCELNFVTRIIYAESSILDGCSHSKHNNSTINDARMVRFMNCENNFYEQSFSS